MLEGSSHAAVQSRVEVDAMKASGSCRAQPFPASREGRCRGAGHAPRHMERIVALRERG
ncbi:hypothetical protein [Halomonas halophila]|uniref:hypothetical protein n=1 Tax=Halomonas halophila TaxID=29573 RepID=UPI00363E73D3